MDTPVLYTAAEVAELLRMNQQVIQRKLQAGEIPGYRIGREWRVERAQLFEWLDAHSNQRRSAADRWFDRDGRLTALPAKRSLRHAVLERLAADFDHGRSYQERDVNAILGRYHDDVASIRREMVAERIMVRSRAGVYKVSHSSEPALRRA